MVRLRREGGRGGEYQRLEMGDYESVTWFFLSFWGGGEKMCQREQQS